MPSSFPDTFREIVSGQRRGVAASLTRSALAVAQHPYRWAIRCRNWRYDHGQAKSHRVEVPVISVGNLTVGGTGKTPMVSWIARWYRRRGVRVALLSRGYGTEAGKPNDEARELAQRLPDCPHLQAPDRISSARIAIEELASQLLILDDGFQHRRLTRDLDVVLIDATQPFGYGHVLPRGLLREPVQSLKRAHIVALTRANLVSEEQRKQLSQELRRLCPASVHIEVEQRVSGLIDSAGKPHSLDTIRSVPVYAFCGIGNPSAFKQTVADLGVDISQFDPFPDHFDYDAEAVGQLSERIAADANSQAAICTHKDLVKLTTQRLGDKPLYAIQLELEVTSGLALLEAELEAVLSKINRDSTESP